METLREQELKDTIAKAVFTWPKVQSYFSYLIKWAFLREFNLLS